MIDLLMTSLFVSSENNTHIFSLQLGLYKYTCKYTMRSCIHMEFFSNNKTVISFFNSILLLISFVFFPSPPPISCFPSRSTALFLVIYLFSIKCYYTVKFSLVQFSFIPLHIANYPLHFLHSFLAFPHLPIP